MEYLSRSEFSTQPIGDVKNIENNAQFDTNILKFN